MAKILTFRGKDCVTTNQPFLTNDSETLSFCVSEGGGVRLESLPQSSLPNVLPDPKKDWSNQELADMFRVHQLLRAANVAVVTDRGVTDEGDPWFVFCHANGEVFIHLCRFDGYYLLDSPNVRRPLRGADFNELIADFTNQALPTHGSTKETDRRVIKLERGGKVRLHPSAMLAALIWTLLLASDELILLAPDESSLDDDTLLDFDRLLAVETPDVGDNKSEDEAVDLGEVLNSDIQTEDYTAPNAAGLLRETITQQQGLIVQNNAINMGLSAVAIAMGFLSESVLVDSQRKVLESLNELGLSGDREGYKRIADLDIMDNPENSAILAILLDFLGVDHSPHKDVADAIMLDKESIDQTQDQAHLTYPMLTPDAETVPVALDPITFEPVRDKIVADEGSFIELSKSNAVERIIEIASAEVYSTPLSSDVLHAKEAITLTSIVQKWQPKMEEIQLGQIIVKASFDISEMDTAVLFDIIETTDLHGPINVQEKSNLDISGMDIVALDVINTPDTQGPKNLREYDELATRLINFLEASEDEIGVIEFDDQIIMVDLTAATGGDTDFIHWEAEDGRTLSFIGLAGDLQAFDMIA